MTEQTTTESGHCFQITTRTLLRLTGGDRQKWLHNFCTADIKTLEPGQGCEAFVLNVKGKTIAHAIVLASKYDLTVIVIGKPEIPLTDHFDKYIITEDVQVEDLGDNQELWYARGSRINSMFESSFPADQPYSHALVRDRSIAISTRISGRRDWLLVVNKTENMHQWYGGMQMMDAETFDKLRFASRFPITGVDVTLDHLPQEYRRDQAAISFTKGCYLGQETVARVDALGHVNYFFVNLNFENPSDPGLELRRDDKVVGKVTSTVDAQGLGFVRRLMANAGQDFDSDSGAVKVAS